MSRPRIGLALGGGGPKGLVHIGVLKVLEKHQIPIDFIAGTSAGAIAGGLYAISKDINEIEKYFIDKNWFSTLRLLDPLFTQGIIQGKKISELLKKFLGSRGFTDLKIPFKAISTNLLDGKTVTLDKGNLVEAIVASCSVPMVFKPVALDGKILVDGGVTSPVPVEIVKKMGADIVIAVNLYHYKIDCQINEKDNFVKIGMYTIEMMMHQMSFKETCAADIVVYPNTKQIGLSTLLNKNQKQQAIHEGEAAMEAVIPKLKHLINKKQRMGIWERIKKLF